MVDTPVVGKPVISAENGFKPFEMKPKVEPAPPVTKPLLSVLSAKYTMQGEMCQYAIDTAAGTVEPLEGASIDAPAWLELLADVRKELIKRGDVD